MLDARKPIVPQPTFRYPPNVSGHALQAHQRPLKQVYDAWRAWRALEAMTLCIAALAQNPIPIYPCIVMAFDYKASNDSWGSEGEYKFHILSPQLVAMFAGSTGRAKELALIYQGYLTQNTLVVNDALKQLEQPLREFKERRASAYIGRTLGVTYDKFLNEGERWLGKKPFTEYLGAIKKHNPNVQMIIAGFIGNDPVLCELRDGELEWRTNFCLIGTGSYTAEPAMHARQHIFTTPKNQALYNVYEAKKIGESSPYVGQKTRMFVLSPPAPGTSKIRAEVVTEVGEKSLKKLLRKYGPRPLKTWPDLPPGTFQVARL